MLQIEKKANRNLLKKNASFLHVDVLRPTKKHDNNNIKNKKKRKNMFFKLSFKNIKNICTSVIDDIPS